MSEHEHTPGPWRLKFDPPTPDYEYPYATIAAGDGGYSESGFHLTGIMNKADACLIAAAPDSHAANVTFVAAVLDEHNIPKDAADDYIADTIGSAMFRAFSMARTAIAKANGRDG